MVEGRRHGGVRSVGRQADVDSDAVGDVGDLSDGLILIRLADDSRVEWQQETGFEAFNRYRGDLALLKSSGLSTQDPGTVALAARQCGLSGPFIDDPYEPPMGSEVFYLVTGVHMGVEGGLGVSSSGVPRLNANPCPLNRSSVPGSGTGRWSASRRAYGTPEADRRDHQDPRGE